MMFTLIILEVAYDPARWIDPKGKSEPGAGDIECGEGIWGSAKNCVKFQIGYLSCL
jgi:hypothetical protein